MLSVRSFYDVTFTPSYAYSFDSASAAEPACWLTLLRPRKTCSVVLTLWAAVVAERLGHSPDTALTLGRAVAGSTARLKVQIIGRNNWKPLDAATLPPPEEQEIALVTLLGKTVRPLPDSEGDLRAAFRTLPTRDGVLADVFVPANSADVRRYLANAFGDQLAKVRAAMQELAERYEPVELNQIGFRLFKRFRPDRPHDNENQKTKVVLEVEKILAASDENSFTAVD